MFFGFFKHNRREAQSKRNQSKESNVRRSPVIANTVGKWFTISLFQIHNTVSKTFAVLLQIHNILGTEYQLNRPIDGIIILEFSS